MNKYLNQFLLYMYMYMFIEKKNLLIVYLISYIKIEFIGFFKKIDFFFGSCFS